MQMRYRVLQSVSSKLPLPLAYWLADRVADAQWWRSVKDRNAVAENLQLIDPVGASPQRERQVFRNFGHYLVEFFAIHGTTPTVQFQGEHHLQEAHAQGRGVISLTGHLGNWELAGVCVRRRGYAVSGIALRHRDEETDRLFNHRRSLEGLGVIPLGPGAWRESLQVLQRGEVLGILGDRDFTNHGIRLPFFSASAVFPLGPALLSLRSGAPVVPTFLLRQGPMKFQLIWEPAIRPPAHRSASGAAEALTREYVRVLESYIRRWPDQWLMFQPARVG